MVTGQPTNPFRPQYRELSDIEKRNLALLKDKANDLLTEIAFVKDDRYRALAITALEQSVMWAVKGITG